METTYFEALIPRLSAAETNLYSIRRDLQLAIAQAHVVSTPEPAAEPGQSLQDEPHLEQAYAEPNVEETEARAAPSRPNLEDLLGGKWLHLAGLLLVFLGTAFFLKVAFDHDWIAPAYRVALGLVAGAATIAWAQLLARKGQTYFSEGLTALGAAIEFLSLYASSALFNVASPLLALGGMIAVNALLASLAWRHRSARLGVLAAIGGFLAPVLAGTANVDPWMLAAYVGTLCAGLLLLGELIRTRVVAPLALAGALAYSAGYFAQSSDLDALQRAAIFGGLYLIFVTAGWIATKVRGALDPVTSIAGGVALGGLLLGIEWALGPEHRSLLAGALITLAAGHAGAAIALKSKYQGWLAATALTFAMPAAFDRGATNVAWAVEAAALTIAGFRFRDGVLKIAGQALLAADVVRDCIQYATYVAATPIFNERFAALCAAFTSAFAMAFAANRYAASEYDRCAVPALRCASHAIALALLSVEAWDAARYFGGSGQASGAVLSVVWAAFAATLIACGLYKRDGMLRWEGLGLLVVTASKVLLIDLSVLDVLYRVISFMLVGIASIGVSYAYQRRSAADRNAA